MKRYTKEFIQPILERFMEGQTSVEEEHLLTEYFRTQHVPHEWNDYKKMFAYFDNGMKPTLHKKAMWIAIASGIAAACALALFMVLQPNEAEKSKMAEQTIAPEITQPSPSPTISIKSEEKVAEVKPSPTKARKKKRKNTPTPAMESHEEFVVELTEKEEETLAAVEEQIRQADMNVERMLLTQRMAYNLIQQTFVHQDKTEIVIE